MGEEVEVEEVEEEAPFLALPLAKSRQKAVPASGKCIDDSAIKGDELVCRRASESNLFPRHCQTFLAAVPAAAIFASVGQLHLHRWRKNDPFHSRKGKGGMFLLNAPYRENLHNIRSALFVVAQPHKVSGLKKIGAVCSYKKKNRQRCRAASKPPGMQLEAVRTGKGGFT